MPAPRPARAAVAAIAIAGLIVAAEVAFSPAAGSASRSRPGLSRLGSGHSDPRRGPILDPRRPPRRGNSVWIQATYDRRGNPSLVANFAPNGGLATPHWAICSPPTLACRFVASKSQFLEPGHSEAGTVFEASAVYRGQTFTDQTAVWSGQLHAVRSPWLQGRARAGARVRPHAAAWLGGWRAVWRTEPSTGSSGGHAPDFDSLSVEACRTRTARHCVNLTPQGSADYARGPVRVPRRFIGWYLFAFDERFAADTAFAWPGYRSPSDIPPLKLGATVARSAPVGPVRA